MRNPDRGTTLLEVMIAIVILGFGVISTFECLSRSLNVVADLKRHTLGLILAQSKLEEIESGVERGVWGQFGDGCEGFFWKVEGAEDRSKGGAFRTVKVSWIEGGEKRIGLCSFDLFLADEAREEEP
jgi:prepilin-type N-terminal cleavage/methylation domain-containing protein